jgi:transposase-like protein
MRWPSGVCCIKCGSLKTARLELRGKRRKTNRRVYQCLERPCRHQFTATTGTILHDSHLPLRKWFLALAIICDAKKGLSANQLKRHLKVNYRTAWYLCHRIRKAMEEALDGKMKGIVEVDETYIGGKYDRRRKRAPWEKTGVVGLAQRKGKVQAELIPTASKQVLVGIIKDRISPEAEMVVTDELAAYKSVGKTHRHAVINHIREYVRGNVHTNTVENFWSLLKRGIIGSFHKVSIKHLPRYLAEFTYRFNNRDVRDLFSQTLASLVNRINLPYRELTASE